MKYFNTLPTITQQDFSGNYITVTNLISRAYLLPSLRKNLYLFYDYTLKDIDTPENVSYKYYNDVERFWLIMYANDLMHPTNDWPMKDNLFIDYLIEKYTNDTATYLNISPSSVTTQNVIQYISSTTHHYEQTISTHSSAQPDVQSITIQVDHDTFVNTVYQTQQYYLNGETITKEISGREVKIYDYENETNESKRNINLLRDVYAGDVEKQLATIMR